MKILLVGDVHWSRYSSIVRSLGKNFTTRLENLIQSMQFVESISDKYKCTEEIFLGDFFDRPDIQEEEGSALSEIEWSTNPRIRHFIVGNHESGVSSLVYSSTKVFSGYKGNNSVVDTPMIYPLDENTEILFLPYITEDNRKPLKEYTKDRNPNKKLIILSHNDIKDFQMGPFLSTTGFSISEIEENCDLYVNGHLHNGGWVTRKILNLGNLTGQNFSEDATKYEHHIAVLDTDTLAVEFIENPYAMNFYKFVVEDANDLDALNKIKTNAVVSVKSKEKYVDEVKKILDTKEVVAYRVVLVRDELDVAEADVAELRVVDHLKQFCDFVLARDDIENINITKEELMEVCK